MDKIGFLWRPVKKPRNTLYLLSAEDESPCTFCQRRYICQSNYGYDGDNTNCVTNVTRIIKTERIEIYEDVYWE